MKFSADNLRVKDLHTLVEAAPPADRSRPLEWRRRLNRFRFEASSFSVDSTHWVNESDYVTGDAWKNDQDRNEFPPVIKAAIKKKISVSTSISFDDIEDRFYQTSVVDEEQKLVTVSEEMRAKKLVVTLSEDEPQGENFHSFKAGSYYGNAMFVAEDQELLLEITANKDVLLDLITAISSGQLEKVIFNVSISSFSYEVDDALREWYHSRDLLIHGFSTPAALQAIVIRRRNKSISTESANLIDLQSRESERGLADKTGLLSSSENVQNMTTNIAINASMFKKIQFALWTIAAVLFLIFLK